jgi:hypothetical protein
VQRGLEKFTASPAEWPFGEILLEFGRIVFAFGGNLREFFLAVD